MSNERIAARLDAALRSAGVPITSVSIGDVADRATWRVIPLSLQAQAQAVIEAFDPLDTTLIDAELDAEVHHALDAERLISAVVWTILDTYSAPATIPKYNVARTKIINVFKSQPWKP